MKLRKGLFLEVQVPRRMLICARVIAVATLLAAGCASAEQKPFTLEQVMSAPFPTELVAAPAQGKLAWVFDARGARNIWIAEPPDYKARAATTYTDDDGQDLGDLRWTPDGKALVYTRGGDLEHLKEEYPNPRSLPQGVEQNVWMIAIAPGAQPQRLGEGHSAAVSPQGGHVAFINKGQVWLAEIGGAAKGEASEKASQLIHARGEASTLRWSPDGSRLAFVSQRGDHSLIGVYDFTGKTLVYVDPSVDQDAQPVWSPDGKRIAFIRIPSSQELSVFGPKRSAQPWSIRIADPTSGTGHEVWRAQEGKGSVFREVQADNQLLWGARDCLIFPWERDGWTHLYSVSVGGGQASLLTPGQFEVEYVALSPDRKEVIFNSNQDDIDRRHIWREPAAPDGEGSRPARVTQGTGIEWAPVATSDGHIALLRSDAQRPARPAILLGSADPRDVAPEAIPADFPDRALVVPQPVMISAADGLHIHGQLFLPDESRSVVRRPAVIFFHGGSRRQMLLGWHYMSYYSNAYALNQYLASRGYIVLSVNYRSGIGYGMEFREALNYGATGASEFNDVEGAGLYLRSRAEVDPKRIGLWGGSYGGYLTALGLARSSDLFAAGVDLHGVHDWNLEIRNWIPSYDPQAKPDGARVAWESSPLASIKTWRSPVLLIQGDDDRNVPFSEMVRLVEALRKQGVEFQQLVFPDEIHDFLTHRRWLEAYHAAADFFDRHLAP